MDRRPRLAGSYSLEAQERNVREPEGPAFCASTRLNQPADITFRHSGWQNTRDLIRAALIRTAAPESRLAAWDSCGADAWVMRSLDDPQKYKVAAATCKDRFCVPCADARSARIGRRIRDKVAASAISFITLTLADSDVSLSALLDKLLSSFRKLRRWNEWTDAVAGGVAFIEIKWSDAKQRWHPHLHCIVQAGWIDQRHLSDRWLAITQTSFIVHIKRVSDAEQAIRYVTKYGSKPLNNAFVHDPARLDEAIESLRGRHLCLAFGSWRGWALTDDDDPERERWEPLDTLSSLIARADNGDDDAAAILEKLRSCMPHSTSDQPRAPPTDAPF